MSMQNEEGTVAQCFENSKIHYLHISIVRSVDAYIAIYFVLPSFSKLERAVFVAQRIRCHGGL